MMGGNPRQMARMMKQMGIDTNELPAKRVIIECEGYNVIIEDPSVTEIDMKGQKSYQIAGESHREDALLNEDIDMVMQQASVDRDKAIQALKDANGDIADAILKLSDE